MKKYIFEIEVHEGSDEFWDRIKDQRISGCDELLEEVKEIFRNEPQLDVEVKLVKFIDE